MAIGDGQDRASYARSSSAECHRRRDRLAGAVLCTSVWILLSGWLTMCLMLIGRYANALARCANGALALTILVLHAVMTAPNAACLFKQLLDRVWCQAVCFTYCSQDDDALPHIPISIATPSPPSRALEHHLLSPTRKKTSRDVTDGCQLRPIWLVRLLGLVHATIVFGSGWVLHATNNSSSSSMPPTAADDACHHALAHRNVKVSLAVSLTLSICSACILLLCC